MAQGILYTLSCQSKSMVFGEIFLRVDRLAEDFYSKCSSTVDSTHQYNVASLDEQNNPVQTSQTVTINNVQLIRFTFLNTFKTLENLRSQKDIPNVLHLRHSISYSFADPAFNLATPQPSLGVVLNSLNYSSYNCPKNCLLCSDDVYPNGKCFQCSAVRQRDQNYDSKDTSSCTCAKSNSKVEDYKVIKLSPDDSSYDLTTTPNPAIQADLQKALVFFADPAFFSYSCQSISYYNQNSCFNSTIEFFDPKNLKIIALASSRILTFDLSITNSAGKILPAECSSSIKSTTFLLFQGDQSETCSRSFKRSPQEDPRAQQPRIGRFIHSDAHELRRPEFHTHNEQSALLLAGGRPLHRADLPSACGYFALRPATHHNDSNKERPALFPPRVPLFHILREAVGTDHEDAVLGAVHR